MIPLDFLSKAGLFTRAEFLSGNRCAGICLEMRNAERAEAEVYGTDAPAVNRAIRTASEVELRAAQAVEIAQRIAALQPDLEDHFRVTLTGCEEPTFLVYAAGGFYRPHRDRSLPADAAAGDARARRVSTVLFLNDDYTGGALTLYGLVKDPAWRDYGFAVTPAPGLLVAFASDLLHEVTPVIAGERCTVANWFRA